MRRSLLALVLSVGSIVSVVEAAPPPPAEVAADTFPLPSDAEAPQAVKEEPIKGKSTAGGRIRTYNVPRGREPVVTEIRASLKTGKWEILKDEPSPSGNAVRFTVKKNGKTWKASVTGDDKRAVIIVTAP